MVAGWIRRGICDITPPKSSGEFGQKRENCILSYLIPPSPSSSSTSSSRFVCRGAEAVSFGPFSHLQSVTGIKSFRFTGAP
ncbi:hypothetical protein INR49_020010 [Caranx melampygus]|nr:hypothetical protein INR49_020010 [Caranx melampygus]